jgi:excisionase family DNA binding protein
MHGLPCSPRLSKHPLRSYPVSRNTQELQRQELLKSLFGPQVPPELAGAMLRTSDVAALFQVSERTISEWARRGRIPSVRTPGGHRRYPADQIRLLLDETGKPRAGFVNLGPPTDA